MSRWFRSITRAIRTVPRSTLPFTSVLGKGDNDFIKVVTWYDNEWGYSCRTADLAALMASKL